MSEQLEQLLCDLDSIGNAHPDQRAACRQRTVWLRLAATTDIRELLQRIGQRPPPASRHEDELLADALQQLVSRQRDKLTPVPAGEVNGELCGLAVQLYRHLGAGSVARQRLLAWLGATRSATSLAALADLLATDPPAESTAVATIMTPLFQRTGYDPHPLFPRILDGLTHPSAAAAILDLANFVTRQHMLRRHPAVERLDTLVALFSGVVGRLGRLETEADAEEITAEELATQVNEGVALAVSLCDALALIGEKSVVGKLRQALQLTHRRLRAEAAAALARLGDQDGIDTLVALAAEPVVRLRVLAYAEELGLLEKIDRQYLGDEAEEEAELALWLAQPAQMGFPPTACELLDSRTQFWPGYDEPVQCFLFRFTYKHGDREFSNVGLAGPAVHAFGADLTELSVEDMYAAFAGWHAEHAEIAEHDVHGLSEPQRVDVFRLERRLRDAGYEALESLRLCSFFGEKVLVAHASQQGTPGVAVADARDVDWLPRSAHHGSLGPDEAFCIYKGRRLLRAFNQR